MPKEATPRTVVVMELDGIKYHVDQAFKHKEALQTKMQDLQKRRASLEKDDKPVPVSLMQESNAIMRKAVAEQLWAIEAPGYEDWKRGDLGDLIAEHVQKIMWSLGQDFIPEDVAGRLPTTAP